MINRRLARTIPQFSDWVIESTKWTDDEVVTNFLAKLSDFCTVVHVSVYGSKYGLEQFRMTDHALGDTIRQYKRVI
jgi:hypothetical protein